MTDGEIEGVGVVEGVIINEGIVVEEIEVKVFASDVSGWNAGFVFSPLATSWSSGRFAVGFGRDLVAELIEVVLIKVGVAVEVVVSSSSSHSCGGGSSYCLAFDGSMHSPQRVMLQPRKLPLRPSTP